jgi:hypothetical protein
VDLSVYAPERYPRMEKVTDRLFGGEEAVVNVMGWVGGAPPVAVSWTGV